MNLRKDMPDAYYLMAKQPNAPYFRMWQRRYSRLIVDNDCWYLLAIHFSPQYFEKLKKELGEAGYEVTIWSHAEKDEDVIWCSDPVGCFFVSNALKGESFVFIDWGSFTFKKM